ncbi:restriction endonuclease subunit S, partial [Limosilactobacillus agrestis]|nr:restriction endonuclease subunit S [Limosilactobacillus agrestis]
YIIYTPSENEQNKISDLILTIQKLIDLQQRKLKQLKRLKTAMLQQLFVEKNSKLPILRFKNFNGNWEKRKFSELATIRRGLTYKPKDVRDSGKNSKRVLRSSNINENSFVIYNDDVFVDKSSSVKTSPI